MSVLTNMKARGIADILITTTDKLNGFTDTIRTVFPESKTQICVVHQIRNACKYVVWKDKKAFTTDMKEIYNAPTKQAAEAVLPHWNRDKCPREIRGTGGKKVAKTFFKLVSLITARLSGQCNGLFLSVNGRKIGDSNGDCWYPMCWLCAGTSTLKVLVILLVICLSNKWAESGKKGKS